MRVARPAQRACEVARLVTQVPRLVGSERLDEAQQRAPALHRAAKIVHRLRIRLGRIGDGRVPLRDDGVGHGAQSFAHRHVRPQGRCVVHWRIIIVGGPATIARRVAFSSGLAIAT